MFLFHKLSSIFFLKDFENESEKSFVQSGRKEEGGFERKCLITGFAEKKTRVTQN
jgi:hypothetical protein